MIPIISVKIGSSLPVSRVVSEGKAVLVFILGMDQPGILLEERLDPFHITVVIRCVVNNRACLENLL